MTTLSLLALEGLLLHVDPEILVLESDTQLGLASTAVLGGGLQRGRCVVSVRVPADYSGRDPVADIRRAARSRGWEPDVGLMTAVELHRVRLAAASAGGVTALAAVTAGVSRLWSAGSGRGPHRQQSGPGGTINTLVLVDCDLTPGAALNLLTTVTEAKVVALLEAGMVTPEGEPASGTATDAVVVAWQPRGGPLPFGGPATAVGWAAAAATRQALQEALGD